MDIQSLIKEEWGLEGDLHRLPGYEDTNYQLKCANGDFLLKISDGKISDLIRMQVDAMKFMGFQVDIISKGNQTIRLLPWLEGDVWADYLPKTKELYYDLGVKGGQHNKMLASFSHPSALRENFEWDLAQSLWIREYLDLLEEDIQEQVIYFLKRFEDIQGTYVALPKGVIHNDMNDYNILVGQNKVTGFIDYGDMCYSQRINDLAILLAYAAMDSLVPLDICTQVIRGYSSVCKLEEEEIECLYTLLAMRLCVSIVSSQINFEKDPQNEYLLISRAPATDLLSLWYNINEKFATYKFKEAAKISISHSLKIIDSYVEKNKVSAVCPMQEDDYLILDLSVGSTELGHEAYYNDPKKHEERINALLEEAGKTFAIGSYDEIRPLYSSDDFTEIGNEGQRWRTVHIGLDFFQKAGTEVYAFASGSVHALHYNEGDKNYGNTVILEHEGFYTLYGHLSSKTLEHLKLGQQVSAGELIAWFGEARENGNWAPHLHFQIILDMLGYENDYPGVCFFEERDVWTQLSPDPRPYLGIRPPLHSKLDSNAILSKRKDKLGRSYSLSYKEPLHIVRAHGQYLYDDKGRKFLDCVNNVPHVGHQNINVIEPAMRQMQLLNTNTRYLHENIVKLAEKLTATLPENLKVCHFVNSGSEANELAIRMARVASGKHGVVAMEHGYHGNTNLCVDISSYKFNGKGGQGQKDYVQLVPMPDPVRPASRGRFELDGGKERPACFIHESILSCGGQVVMPEGFFGQLYHDFREKGLIMIADEVQTGLGRVGSHMWAFEAESISPDIVTIGKPFGNGHPLAAVVCTEEIANAFHNGMEYFNTFGGNPVSCSIGLAVLNEIEGKDLRIHAKELGAYIKDKIKDFQNDHPIIADVRGRGFFLGWEFADPESKAPLAEKASIFVNEMKRFGILLSTDGPMYNVIKFKPPMVFNQSNADYMLEQMKRVLAYLDND